MGNKRIVWIDHLRSSLIVLVVAHHSCLAYTTFAYFDTKTYINSTHPIVDHSRWIGMDVFVNFNDIFFMSLLFFISGLFLPGVLIKKGEKNFLKDRFKRLGIPFIIGVTVIIPFAYLPSFYLNDHSYNFLFFIKDYLINQQWPSGPLWFIWVLLLFNVAAVFIPLNFYTYISNRASRLAKTPGLFLIAIFIIVSLAYTPVSLWLGQYKWIGIGPFDFQANRLLLYFTFFISGAGLGSSDWESFLFTDNKCLNKPWQFWVTLCLVSYLSVEVFTYTAWDIVRAGRLAVNTAWFIFDLAFVLSCIFTIIAFLSIFKQFFQAQSKLWKSLSANAFGIYLIHYIFITWLQFALSDIALPVLIKFLLVFLFTLLASWIIIIYARKYKTIDQII